MVNGALGTVNGRWRRAAGGWPYFVYGWREVFVPLVVLVHNEHGPLLALAGLAVAASRLGGWLLHKTERRRPLREASLLCGIALLFLGLAPEEGPINLLLWFLFGLGWPALHSGLVGRTGQRRPGLAVLLVGMVAAGPLARGPGTWLIAAGCLLLAWQAGKLAPQAVELQPPEPAEDWRWTPFLFSAVYLGWVWLLPAQLSEGALAPELVGGLMAASWLARSLSAAALAPSPADHGAAGSSVSRGSRRSCVPTVAALLLVPTLAAVAWVQQPALAALAFVVYGALLGVISTRSGIARGELGQLPGARQALGEWVGPLLGAGLALVGGSTTVFVGAALAAVALAWSLRRPAEEI